MSDEQKIEAVDEQLNDISANNNNNINNDLKEEDANLSNGVLLYYTPRILPPIDIKQEKNLKKANYKRFIHSIVRSEMNIFQQLLAEHKFNINMRGQMGWTCILWAVQKNRIQFLKILLNYSLTSGLVINFKKQTDNKTKRNILHFACEHSNEEIIELLIDYHFKSQQLKNGNSSAIEIVNAVIADIDGNGLVSILNDCDWKHATPLYRACQSGNEIIIHLLLKTFGKQIHTNIVEKQCGLSPLMVIAKNGHLNACRKLLPYLSLEDINIIDDRGRNAFMIAAAENRIEICELLVNDSDLNVVDVHNYGWNVLMWICYRKNEKIARMILKSHSHRINLWYMCMSKPYKYQTVLDLKPNKNLIAVSASHHHHISYELRYEIRNCLHRQIFSVLMECGLVLQLKIPIVVITQLLLATY